MSKRRYVARGVPGGYRIGDNTARRWWGELCELYPDLLLEELNSKRRSPDRLRALARESYRLKR